MVKMEVILKWLITCLYLPNYTLAFLSLVVDWFTPVLENKK